MTDVALKLAQDRRWVRVELRTAHDMVEGLVARLDSNRSLSRLFSEASIDLSLFALGPHIEGQRPISNMDEALLQMLQVLKRQQKRLLITVDEVVNNSYVRDFASLYQSLVREDMPVFPLMCGLYENVESLQNGKNLTYLFRAPKIRLEPLGMRSIALNYERTLSIDHGEALRMAHLTNGYSFAFQLLGHLVWEHHGLTDEALDEYQAQLFELSYDKIWSGLSDGDNSIAHGIAAAQSSSVMDVRSFLDLKSNEYSPYRRRLIRKGVIDGSERVKVTFTLLLFREYVLERYGEIDI